MFISMLYLFISALGNDQLQQEITPVYLTTG